METHQVTGSLKIHLTPVGLYSRAMVRVADALTQHAPVGIEFVNNPDKADLRILHVISHDAIEAAREMTKRGQKYVIIQYCLRTTETPDCDVWADFWRGAALVWSYYDLSEHAKAYGFNFYHSPLGVDEPFIVRGQSFQQRYYPPAILTSGYVSGPGAEPIAEVWQAAAECGWQVFHLGPKNVVGVGSGVPTDHVKFIHEVDDERLARVYQQCTLVSGMRHIEGFELPAAEALASGTVPIVFDQPTTRLWHGEDSYIVSECGGEPLMAMLNIILREHKEETDNQARLARAVFARERYNWRTIAPEFWTRMQQNLGGRT